MIQLLEHAQLVARLHAAQKHDGNGPLVRRQDRFEPAIGTLIGSLVAGGAGLVIMLGKPAIGRQLRGNDTAKVGAGPVHRGLEGRHEVRACRADHRDGSEQSGGEREVGRRSPESVGVGAHRGSDVVARDRAGDQQSARLRAGHTRPNSLLISLPRLRGREGGGLSTPRAIAGRVGPARPRPPRRSGAPRSDR